MTDEADLLNALAANPADDMLRLVYADWLEENLGDGRAAKAEFLRLEAEKATAPADRTTVIEKQLSRLSLALSRDWLAVAGKRPLENCSGPRFSYACPLQWESLTPTDQPTVRHCDSCQQEVFFCETINEANTYARAGFCVAISAGQRRRPGDLRPFEEFVTMGVLAPSPEPPDMSGTAGSDRPAYEGRPSQRVQSALRRIRRRFGL